MFDKLKQLLMGGGDAPAEDTMPSDTPQMPEMPQGETGDGVTAPAGEMSMPEDNTQA